MKKKILVILSIFTLLFIVSCGSKPEEEAVEPEAPVEIEAPIEETPEEITENAPEETPVENEKTPVEETPVEETPVEETPVEETPLEEITQEEADVLLAEVESARARAIEAGAEAKYPDELKEANDYFNSIKDDKSALKSGYIQVVGLYDSLTSKIETDNSRANLLAAIEAARAKAVEAGAEEYVPEELKQVDDYTSSLKEDNEKLDAEGAKVPGYYNTLIDMTNDIICERILSDIASARTRAVEAGVDKTLPEELENLDEYVEDLKENKGLLMSAGPAVPASYDELINKMSDRKIDAKVLKSIEVSRNKALKAGAQEEAPEELEKLDEYFNSLRENKEEWQFERENISGYYDSLTVFVNDKKIAANIFVNIDSSREKAIEAGAETKAADILKRIDEYRDLIRGNSGSVKANGHKVSNSYKSLVPYIGAIDAKKIIDEENLAPYAQNFYDRASEKMASVEQSYKDIDDVPQSIIRDATDSRRDFRSVISIAYKDMANTAREAAYAEKKNADKVRAGVTQKDRYKVAVENFQKGDSLYSMQDPKNAIKYYDAAKEEFAALNSDVSEDMLAALAAIEAAKKNVAESSQYAEEADEMAPIKSKDVEGIEDEDTVLLEADDYEDPNASVIAVDDVVEVSEDNVVEDDIEELVTDEQYVDVVVEENAETEDENEDVEDEVTESDEISSDESENSEVEDAETAPIEDDSVVVPEETTEPESTETVEQEETIPNESVTEDSEKMEESSEDRVETPVITDEVVTDTPAATEENNEVSKDDFFNSGVFAK